jgi:hypothetical protein
VLQKERHCPKCQRFHRERFTDGHTNSIENETRDHFCSMESIDAHATQPETWSMRQTRRRHQAVQQNFPFLPHILQKNSRPSSVKTGPFSKRWVVVRASEMGSCDHDRFNLLSRTMTPLTWMNHLNKRAIMGRDLRNDFHGKVPANNLTLWCSTHHVCPPQGWEPVLVSYGKVCRQLAMSNRFNLFSDLTPISFPKDQIPEVELWIKKISKKNTNLFYIC